jgi:opacity protein-like surface antigen
MIKRLALVICCILLLPTIAAASDGSTNYGDWWVGGQVMGVFTLDRNVNVTGPFGLGFTTRNTIQTDAAFGAGAIVGYNFCLPDRPSWQRYFGVALDFQWNQFNQSLKDFSGTLNGNQFALAFLGRLQYPLMGDESYTRGRWVPFLMAGPAVVWSSSDFKGLGGNKTSTNVGVDAEIGFEYFVMPQLSIGPSFRYRHVFGPNVDLNVPFQNGIVPIKLDSQLDQFMVVGRLAYHF